MKLADIKTPDQIEEFAIECLDAAIADRIGLEERDSDYDLAFIEDKLKVVAKAQEKVSDFMMQLSRVSLEVIKAFNSSKTLYELKVRTLKESDDYEAQPREKKTLWLENQLAELTGPKDRWDEIRRLVSEIKETIGQRAQDLKRLDSDLRLYSKLLEAKSPGQGSGNGSPTSGRGTAQRGELDIN